MKLEPANKNEQLTAIFMFLNKIGKKFSKSINNIFSFIVIGRPSDDMNVKTCEQDKTILK